MKRSFVVTIDDVEPEESVISDAFMRMVLRQNPYMCATNPEVSEIVASPIVEKVLPRGADAKHELPRGVR